MRIALAQHNYHIGNFELNFEKMAASIDRAKRDGADIVVFSELSVCGYPPRDFLEFSDFIDRSLEVIDKLAALALDIAVIAGAPSVNPVVEGKDLFNSAYFMADGKVQQVVNKTLLPTYDIFDEYRYFEPNSEFKVVEYKGQKLALTICEDIWNVGNENPLYRTCPMDHLIEQNPDLIINLSASPFDYTHAESRREVLKANADKYGLPMVYVNAIGAQTEVVFDGGSLVSNHKGQIVAELDYFKEDFAVVDTSALEEMPVLELESTQVDRMYNALVLGVRDYFGKLGFRKAILGLSGGIDSALTLCIAAEALGAENVLSVMLPSEYSSDHSISDSEALCQNLGSPVHKVSIQESYQAFLGTLDPFFKDMDFNVAEENIQARCRGVILMAFSNKFGYILLNTSNKSEAAVGYGTLYGDMCGGLSVLGDAYKTEVYELARYINRNGEVLPENIITKPPSAELRPNQFDSDSLPDYDILDRILLEYIENRKGPAEIVALGFEEALVKRVLRMVNMNEWKRYQTAPMIRVSPKAFGMGRRVPIVARYLS